MKAKNLLVITGFTLVLTTGCKHKNPIEAAVSGNTIPPTGYVKVWEDQFDGPAIDSTKWVVANLRDPVTGDRIPGASGDHLLNKDYAGYITQEDTYVENGSLVLRNQKRSYAGTSPAGNYNYTSGWVMSMHRAFFNQGYIEIKAQFPSGDKVWPALWMGAEDLVWGPEWDLFEYFGYRGDVGYDNMGMHLLYGTYPGSSWSSDWIKPYDSTYNCEAWHVYGFEWTDSFAAWYIDGVEVRRLNRSTSEANGLYQKWPNEEMYIILNNGQRTESPDMNTTWPNYLTIDYVKVYKKQ